LAKPLGNPILLSAFEADVRAGLTKPGQKELYSKYFYDDVGAALFEAITQLPEYGLTRADLRILRRHARELPLRAGQPSVVVELGSGSGEKAREILPHLVRANPLTYCPVDVSRAALTRCQRDLADIPNLTVVPVEDTHLGGLSVASGLRKPGTSVVVLFLGSSIGNFEPNVAGEFLRSVRENLTAGDIFLLSTDLVKPTELMLPAYDDSIGLTAAFNFNLLARINRELGANFDLTKFRHEARYDHGEQRMEMHLRSIVDQTVTINRRFTVELAAGETIWTESSYKFHTGQIRAMSEKAGWTCEVQWIDREWPFAQTVLRASEPAD
jgi:L-histidine Nalpha-methyltransferase